MSVPVKEARVSVILSTYNRAPLLGRAIDSVLAQDYPQLELIVIDDGSVDDTASVLGEYRAEPRLRSLPNDSNIGLQASLNRGIALADGEFLARIDDDDCWTDTFKVQRQVDHMLAHPDCALLGTAYVDEGGVARRNPLSDAAIRRQMLFRCPFCHSSVMIRTTALAEVGHYDESLAYAEDWDLWMRLGRAWKLANLPEVTVRREQGNQTLSEQYFTRQLRIAQTLGARHGADYPGRRRARCYHAASRAFFGLFPIGGRVHRIAAKLFHRVFGLAQPPA